MADITNVDALVSASLHEKSVWLWSLHERLAALESIPRPTIEEIAQQVFDIPVTVVCTASTGTTESVLTNLGGVVGHTLDLDAPRYQAAFVECAECHAKPGTPILCQSCLANRDKIYTLRMALETANGLARQWKLNYDNLRKPTHDPYELAAHWRDKAGEALNRAEKAEAAASQAIDERDVWVRDCKAAEARADKVERHDKAMSEEVARLRKELDKAREAADTLERLRKGYRVDGQILVTSHSTFNDLRTERDALAATVERFIRRCHEDGDSMIVPTPDEFGRLLDGIAEAFDRYRDDAAKVADLERRLAKVPTTAERAVLDAAVAYAEKMDERWRGPDAEDLERKGKVRLALNVLLGGARALSRERRGGSDE